MSKGMRRPLRAASANPLGLALLLASLLLALAMALLPALRPWSGRATWILALGVGAYVFTVLVVAWERRRGIAPRRQPAVEQPLADRTMHVGPPRTDSWERPAAVPPKSAFDRRDYPDGLTAREVEVLRMLAGGKTNKEIAALLVLSIPTVERHIANIYAKIGARGRAEATVYALTHGLADPSPSTR